MRFLAKSSAVPTRPQLAAAVFRRFFVEALRREQFSIAGALANLRHGCAGFFRFTQFDGPPEHVSAVRLVFNGISCTIEVHSQLSASGRLKFVAERLSYYFLLLAACRDAPKGFVWLNLDDIGRIPGLVACDSSPDYQLVPDPIYLATHAYQRTADYYRDNDVAWAQKQPVAFWRGTTTGQRQNIHNWQELDRVRLCLLAGQFPNLFDVGFTDIVQMNAEESAAIRASGLMRAFVPETDFITYRYQIDIDGNTNSWPGLFQKLLSGSPVLKIASRGGYRQWYYDRLKPWENFVPVESDMSDLVEKIKWLVAHDDQAQRIGAAGRSLALSMGLTAELQQARETVFAAIRP